MYTCIVTFEKTSILEAFSIVGRSFRSEFLLEEKKKKKKGVWKIWRKRELYKWREILLGKWEICKVARRWKVQQKALGKKKSSIRKKANRHLRAHLCSDTSKYLKFVDGMRFWCWGKQWKNECMLHIEEKYRALLFKFIFLRLYECLCQWYASWKSLLGRICVIFRGEFLTSFNGNSSRSSCGWNQHCEWNDCTREFVELFDDKWSLERCSKFWGMCAMNILEPPNL